MIRLLLLLGVLGALVAVGSWLDDELLGEPKAQQTQPIEAAITEAAITHDGVLAFAILPGEGVIRVDDLLNDKEVARVSVCAQPRDGALTQDEVFYIVVCADADEIAFVNTASFDVTIRVSEGLVADPSDIAVAERGNVAFVVNADGNTFSVIDTSERRVVWGPAHMGNSSTESGVDNEHKFKARDFADMIGKFGVLQEVSADVGKKNEVIVLGMIHDSFRTSRRYSLDVLRQTIRAIDPDYVLAEIPPNRVGAAIRGFEETGKVTEPRTRVFPEYVDALFPLTRDMDFRIIGVAAWNTYMNAFRSAARRRLRSDPAMAHAWSDDEEASAEFSAGMRGRADDPKFIHSVEYDEITRRGFVPDVDYFNAALGPGGWKNINEAHYRLIARTLDRHKGTGKRFLITFGASHKYWFLEELKKRDDIVLLDPLEFFPAAD